MHKDALTLEYAGGKGILPIGHFSQIILWSRKLLTLSINIPTTKKVVKSFFYYLDRISRNSAETNKEL